VLALIGGWAAHASARPPLVRILACLLPVVLTRWVAGTLAAALATACVAAGWWLRVRASDALLVLALFGVTVAVLSPPSARLTLAFFGLGVVTVAARPVSAGVRRGLHLMSARTARGGSPQRSGEQASEVSR
jgi:di/tricarboxylate transporter